jgi:hypothetical protein
MQLQSSSKVLCICRHCGKEFLEWRCHVERDGQRSGFYCSRNCSYEGRRKPLAERFWTKVDKTSSQFGCWLWTGALNRSGYGKIGDQGRTLQTHRVAWELINGQIPDGLFVCHDCDRFYPVGDTFHRRCVRPDHLFLGTDGDNTRDCLTKDRMGVAKLKTSDIPLIWRLIAEPRGKIADIFGVDAQTIHAIKTGKAWSSVSPGLDMATVDVHRRSGRKLTWPQVDGIKECISRGETDRSIAREYGVSRGLIYLIRTGKSWS